MALSFAQTLTLQATPEQVYAALSTPAQWPQWMPNLLGIEPLNNLPFGAGYQWKEIRKMFGQVASEVFEVKEARTPSHLVLYVDGSKGSSRSGYYQFHYALTAEGSGTRLDIHSEIGGSQSWVMKLIGRLFLGMFKKALMKDLLAMKAFVEKG